MEKEFYYTFDGEIYCYIVKRKELIEALANLIFEEYFEDKNGVYKYCSNAGGILKGIEDFIDNYDLEERIYDAYYKEVYEFFRKEAYDEYRY